MNSPTQPLRLGTRGSPLAMAQAHMVADALRTAHRLASDAIAIIEIRTSGDRIQDRALADIGGKALWTKELDRALLDEDIDFAVHSMKDVETIRPIEIAIAAMLPRAAVEDRLVGAGSIAELPRHAILGTSSPRRAAQVMRLRPDVSTVLFRGNVATRLAKLDAGEADATLLAAAGLIRLGRDDVGVNIPVDLMLPAPAQGAVGIECRAGDARTHDLLSTINDIDTYDCVMAERALLAGLAAGCHSPVAALAQVTGGSLHLRAELLLPDGSEYVQGKCHFPRGDKVAPTALAGQLLDQASPQLRALFGP